MNKVISIIISLLIVTSLNARDIVPFKIANISNRPIVEVFVNNDTIPFSFVLDTGCSTIMANAHNSRLCEMLNLCENDTVEYAHSSTIVKKTAFDNKLRLGSLMVDSIQIVADEMPMSNYDGIIGQQLLSRFSRVGIFPDSKIIVFCKNKEPLKISNAVELPLVKANGVYGTKLSINSDTCNVEGLFMLDTGFEGVLSINSKFSNNHNLPNILKRIGSLSSTDGAGAETSFIMVTAPRLIFANESMPLLPIVLDQEQFHNDWENIFNGLIGYDLLKRFRMIWDYENQTISLSPSFEYFSPVNSLNR